MVLFGEVLRRNGPVCRGALPAQRRGPAGDSHLIRLRQCAKLLAFVYEYTTQSNLTHLPLVICGDWNGESDGCVYRAGTPWAKMRSSRRGHLPVFQCTSK